MASQESIRADELAHTRWFNDPRIRGIVYQVLVFAAIVALIYWIVGNTAENLRRANIASGFGFLAARSGFEVAQSLIPFSSDGTFGRALVVGFLNTLLIAVTGIVTATIIGFVIGVGRLANNWLIRKICMVYVEVFRNIPPLLVILFWYQGVLALLPSVRDSLALPFGSYLNNRGFYFPQIIWGDQAWLVLAGLVIGAVLSWYVARRARARQMATGQ